MHRDAGTSDHYYVSSGIWSYFSRNPNRTLGGREWSITFLLSLLRAQVQLVVEPITSAKDNLIKDDHRNRGGCNWMCMYICSTMHVRKPRKRRMPLCMNNGASTQLACNAFFFVCACKTHAAFQLYICFMLRANQRTDAIGAWTQTNARARLLTFPFAGSRGPGAHE